MKNEDFMESYKAKDVLSFITFHINDLSNIKKRLNDKLFEELSLEWVNYARLHVNLKDEALSWFRAAKVRVIDCSKGLENRNVKDIIKNGIGYDEACPSRYPSVLSGLMMRMTEELNYYIIHINKYAFFENIAQTSYAIEKKFKNLTKYQMCHEILTEQIKLLTEWKMEFSNFAFIERLDNKPKQGHTYYFAYGFNINREKMIQRCPSAKRLGEAKLYNYKLIIDDRGSDGGCASIKKDEGSEVVGVLWIIPNEEIKKLDICEGVNLNPPVYKKEKVDVHLLGSLCFKCNALVYISLNSEGYYARDGYIETILRGADEDCLYSFDFKSLKSHIKQN